MLVVDDHVVVRSGLEQLLATTDDIELVGTASNGNEAIAAVAELHPDVVLMDLSMPELDGVEATRRIAADHPSSRVLVLTSFSDQTRILDALSAGADGYLLKHAEPDDIADAIRAVHSGGAPLDPKAARVLIESRACRHSTPQLTDREREVLLLVRDGLANKQIGRRARHRRTDGEGPPDQRLPATRCHRSHAGRTLGERAPDRTRVTFDA